MLGKLILKFKLWWNKNCYENYKNKDGICYGMVGGDKFSDYTCYSCIGCPYHTLFYSKGENNG